MQFNLWNLIVKSLSWLFVDMQPDLELTAEQLNDYEQLTYLTRSEIKYIFKKFITLNPSAIADNIYHRFDGLSIANVFPTLKYNAFSDRLLRIFSSSPDGCLHFEEFLNLCSVCSEHCPLKVKAAWAFLVFDFDEDNQLTKSDLIELLDRLTEPIKLSKKEKDYICEQLLEEMDLQHLGSINQMQFLHSLTKTTDFVQAFTFKP